MSDRPRLSHVSLEVRGIALIAVVAGLIGISVLMYQKAFSDDVQITAVVARTGLQLDKNGDVRVRGALVGRITGVAASGDGAVVHMAVDRQAAKGISAQSSVAILPTTLFGQKFVDLVPPKESGPPLHDGVVLHGAEGANPIEVDTVLDHLEPVLTAVRPHDLSVALNNMAQGLEGRGDALARLISDGRQVTADLNAETPTLIADLNKFATLSGIYADVSPDLLGTLANTTTTARTVTTVAPALTTLFDQGTQSAMSVADLLAKAFAPLVDSGTASRPLLGLFARYAPEYPCLFHGLDVAQPAAENTVLNGILRVHIVLGVQAKGYGSGDAPRNGDVGHGPDCAGLPSGPFPALGFSAAHDGVGGS